MYYTSFMGNHRIKDGFPLLFFAEGSGSPPDERKEGVAMYVTGLMSTVMLFGFYGNINRTRLYILL